MYKVGFIGTGNMGAPMVLNLLKAVNVVQVYDINPQNHKELEAKGAMICQSIIDTVKDVDAVITMLPAGEHVKAVYLGESGIFDNAMKKAVLLECSTIDIATSQMLHQVAQKNNFTMFDAPVSGGTSGAKSGSLTFMVGGDETKLESINPLLAYMGKNIFYAGKASAGQAAKICNNLMLAIHMIGTAEGLTLGKKLGLDSVLLYDICNHSSGQSWSLTNYCPEPDILPNVPSSNDYLAGFMAKMMLKDLKLAEEANKNSGSELPLMQLALKLYQQFCDEGNADMDFSGIIKLL